MNDKKSNGQPSGGMALNDIYFVLFRHQWKIIILSAIGILAALGIYVFKPPTFQSDAEVFIKYVPSEKPQLPVMGDSQARSLDPGVEGIIDGEIAIITSFDLALEVATNVGPAKILGNVGGPNDAAAASLAANRIKENLTVVRVNRSSMLRIIFSHSDASVVQPVLRQLIADYKKLHTAIHSENLLSLDDLIQQVDSSHKEMLQAEDELHRAKNEAKVYNIDKKREQDEQSLAAFNQQIIFVTADLAEHQSRLEHLKPKTSAAVTNNAPKNSVSTNVQADIPKETIAQYQNVVDLLSDLNKDYTKLRSSYPAHNKLVVEKQEQIDDQKKIKKKMEDEEPRLVDYVDPSTKMPLSASAGLSIAEITVKQEEATVESLQRKLKVYQDSAEGIRVEMAGLEDREFHINELERKLKSQQSDYDNWYSALQKKKMQSDLGHDANISIVDEPTPPAREKAKTPKMMGVAAGAGIILGLAWAFLQELYFDHSVKRTKDIEGDMGLRLFLAIPDMHRKAKIRKPKALLPEGDGKDSAPDGEMVVAVNGKTNGNGHMEVAPWDHSHALHHHYEALRDRLITYFEVNNLNHKPKLVAVTGASHGSGTSTLAAGLAASLSETGDGNVLLIDMNLEQGAAQQFYNGKPHCELETALEGDTMKDAKIQDNLYVVAGRTNNGDKLSSMLPKRFAGLIPKLKASDYDYIIFDMPPISRTGVTQRLAGFMDMTMLVVEAEKTSKDIVRQANAVLTDSKAKVSVVLNKTRTYVPARLHQEF